jgi:hypothetical protein
MRFLRKLRPFLSLRKLPGVLLTAFGLGWKLLDIGGRLDLFIRIAESMGGSLALLATALLSPWTSVGLVAVGVGYVVFVGEPEKGAQRHPWWPYAGWALLACSVLSLLIVAGWGAIEFYVREEVAKVQAGIPRNTPDSSSRQQRPLFTGNRNLTPDQMRILAVEFDKIKPFIRIRIVQIAVAPKDYEAAALREQFSDILTRVGLPMAPMQRDPRGLIDEGMAIGVRDPSNPPRDAEKFREALAVANIEVPLVKWDQGSDTFIFFIWPRPFN